MNGNLHETPVLSRRAFIRAAVAGSAAAIGGAAFLAARRPAPELRYILASCLYGKTELEKILPQVEKTGATHIDVWPLRHGNQREQVEAMGHERFAALLERHGVGLGILTRYDLGPFKLAGELDVAKKLGATMIVTGSGGPKGLSGDDLRRAVAQFVEKMKPHAEAAGKRGVTIAIENHSGTLLSSPDAVRHFADLAKLEHLGLALAPYHLPQNAALLAGLVRHLDKKLVHFYAWQHGKGCTKKLPKAEELEQLPGRGSLDFAPILAALGDIDYRGWTEIFMHPVPRGIPILETTAAVTAEVNRARRYLESRLPKPKDA